MATEESSEEFERVRKEVKSIFTRARQTLLGKIQECPPEVSAEAPTAKERLLNLSSYLEDLDVEWETFTLAVLSGRVEKLRAVKDHIIHRLFDDFLCKFNVPSFSPWLGCLM